MGAASLLISSLVHFLAPLSQTALAAPTLAMAMLAAAAALRASRRSIDMLICTFEVRSAGCQRLKEVVSRRREMGKEGALSDGIDETGYVGFKMRGKLVRVVMGYARMSRCMHVSPPKRSHTTQQRKLMKTKYAKGISPRTRL
eukprot:2286707-Rhodomonas_salina.2